MEQEVQPQPQPGLQPEPQAQPPQQLGKMAMRGGALVGAAQAVKIVVQFASVVVLARLLSPDDFGLMASIAPLIAFIALFQDLGLQQAIIQRPTITQDMLNRVFWLTVALGVACAAIVALASPGVAWFFRDDRLLHITAATSVTILIGSLCSLPMSLLNRGMKFGTLAAIDIATTLSNFAIAVIAALLGAEYWSLVYAAIGGTCVNFTGAWLAAKWKPNAPQFRQDRELLTFGANLTGFSFVNYFSRNLDNILIGRHSGSVDLGYYDRAYKLLLFPLQNISNPLARVMVPLLSRIQEDKPRLRSVYLRTVGLLTLVTVPGIAAMAVVAEELIAFLFGERWLPVAPIFAWLGLTGLLQPLNNTTGWIFISQAATRTMFRWGIYGAVTTIASFVLGLKWGAVGVAAAYAITDYVLRLPVLYTVVHRVGPVSAGDLMRVQFPLLAAAAATWGITQYGLRDVLMLDGLPLMIAAGIVSYACAIAFLALLPSGRATLAECVGFAGKIWGGIRSRFARKA